MSITINGTSGIAGVDGSATTPAFQGGDTNTGLFYGTDIVGISTGGSERVRVDASGNVGINTIPRAPLAFAASAGTAGEPNKIRFYDNGGVVTYGIGISDAQQNYVVASGGAHCFYVGDLGSATERMRIDSSGNVQIARGITNNPWDATGNVTWGIRLSSDYGVTVNNTGLCAVFNRTNTTGGVIEFGYNGTARGSVSTNGTNVAYNTSSDYRLKENVTPIENALDKVAQLKPVNWTWKADGSDGQGFIAHELQAIIPDCVTGEKDAVDEEGNPVYQGIDTSFLVATLTKAIQEQQELIKQLQLDVSALKEANNV